MLLYVCPTCGRWQDVSLVKAITDVFANVSKSLNLPPSEQLGYPCAAGHGLMVLVQATDRVYVRSGEVEALEEISKDVSALP